MEQFNSKILDKFSTRGTMYTIGYNSRLNSYAFMFHTNNIQLINMLNVQFMTKKQYNDELGVYLYYFTANVTNTNRIINLLIPIKHPEIVGLSNAARNKIVSIMDNVAESHALNLILTKTKRTQYAVAKFAYNAYNVEIMRKLGATFDTKNKVWKLTLDIASASAILDLREKNPDVYVHNDLLEACKKIVNISEDLYNLSNALESQFEVPVKLGLSLYPFQKAAIEYLAKTNGRCLIADEMGTGKTITTLSYLNYIGDDAFPALIVVPKTLKYNWAREAKKWLIGDRKIEVIEASIPHVAKADIYIINYDILKKYQEIFTKTVKSLKTIIVDEAHYVKNPAAQRSKALYKIAAKHKQANRIMLTGTPIMTKPADIYPIVSFINPEMFRTNAAFVRRYCDAKYTEIWTKDRKTGRAMKRKVLDTSGASNLQELQRYLRSTLMVRRLKEQVMPQLPPISRTLIPLRIKNTTTFDNLNAELTAKLKEYARLRNIKDGNVKVSEALLSLKSEIVASAAELRKLAFLAKFDYIKAFIEDTLEESHKIVVFAFHREHQEKLVAEFSQRYKVVGFHGGETSDKRRDAAVQEFEHGDARLFIATYGAAAEGITLTASNKVIFVELDWQGSTIAQAEARVHRATQTKAVDSYFLVLKNTLDEHVYNTAIGKLDIATQALNYTALEAEDDFEFIDALASEVIVNDEEETNKEVFNG